MKDGSIKVKVKFSEAGVDPSQAVGFNHWMSCTEGDMAGPRQFSATLEPAGLYKEINFKTSTTEDGLAITEKVTEHREVSLEGTMTVSQACSSLYSQAEPSAVLSPWDD